MDDNTISRLFTKIDSISDNVTEIKVSMAGLPCKSHEEKFKSNEQAHKNIYALIKAHWGITVLILAGLVGLAWKAF